MNKKYAIILLLVTSLAACNEPQEPPCAPECIDEEYAVTCDANGESQLLQCTYGCTSFYCNTAPGSAISCIPECNDSKAIVCQADGMPSQLSCAYGCNGLSCARQKTSTSSQECEPMCVDNYAVICNSDGSSDLLECTFGCANGYCLGDPSNPNSCTPKCQNSVAITCDANGLPIETRCDYGCNGLSCASKPDTPPVTSGPCAGVSCRNKGNCNLGICVSQNMATIREGDPCDKWFQGFCNGDTKVTCVGGEIHFSDCSDVHGCAMSIFKQFGDTYLFPTCRKDGASCRSNESGYCLTENNAGKTEDHAYAIACWDNTDQTKSGDKGGGAYLLCNLGCNPQKTTCWNKCDGNTLLMYDNSILNCPGLQQICVTEEQNGLCADPCWQKDEVLTACYLDNERTRECHADDNNKLYYRDTIKPCDHGCDTSTGRCKKLVKDEYTNCDWNTFEQRCENDIRVVCYEGIVRAERCSDEGKSCGVIQNAASCMESCTGPQTSYCDGNDLVTVICEKNQAGILVPVSKNTTQCKDKCNPQKKACTCSTGGYWCENNAITHCDSLTETAIYESCGSKICANVSGDGVGCYDKKFSSEADCEEDYGCNGSTYYSYFCLRSRNDNWYYGKLSETACEKGCSKKDEGCCEDWFGEVYSKTENACVCDTKKHFEGQHRSCDCEDGYWYENGECVLY